MKFFEFSNGFRYYAIIGAENKEVSLKIYNEDIASIDDANATPNEITEADVRLKISTYPGITDRDYQDYENCKNGIEPFITVVEYHHVT